MEGINGMRPQTMTREERIEAIEKMYLNGTVSRKTADKLISYQ